jgi:hypothetical protein
VSDVVLRCPNCGTTQGQLGECEACHEADVRYFCPNHTPGRWLDGPVCAECAARAARERPAPRTPPPRPSPPRTREMPPPVEPRPSTRPPPSTGSSFDDWRERVAGTVRRGPVVIDEGPRREPPAEVIPPRVRVRAPPLLGCAVRLMVVAVVVILAFTVISFVGLVVFGGSVGAWVEDVGQQFGVLGGVPEQTQRGIRAYRAGDLATAERELREAAQSYPRSGMALVYLARMRTDAGDPERAGEYLREAVAREPDNVLAHRALADHHFQRANRQRASAGTEGYAPDDLLKSLAHYQRALELDPTDRPTRGYYACVLAALGQTVDAERMLAEAGAGPWERCAKPAP